MAGDSRRKSCLKAAMAVHCPTCFPSTLLWPKRAESTRVRRGTPETTQMLHYFVVAENQNFSKLIKISLSLIEPRFSDYKIHTVESLYRHTSEISHVLVQITSIK